VVDASLDELDDTAPLDETFSHPEVVTVRSDNNVVIPSSEYTLTIISVTEASNGDGSSDWVVRYRLSFDLLSPGVDALYSAFHWWNEPPNQ